MFVCDQCGLCCMSIGSSPLLSMLDRGDGICRYFDERSKLCTIYPNRPLICNVDKAFRLYFHESMTLDEYYALNYAACRELKRRAASAKGVSHG